MALPKVNPSQTKAWIKLKEHFDKIKNVQMKDLFDLDPQRAYNFSINWQDFYLDYSKNRLSEETKSLLLELAKEVELEKAIQSYFSGEVINETEQRAVLHTALRSTSHDEVFVNGQNIIPEIFEVKRKIKVFSDRIESGNAVGYSGKAFTDVVNIGIGGSDLGPAMVVDTLKYYKNHLNTHFVSNVDGDHVIEVIKNLNPETTLFVIVSKTFTTQETLSNATTIRQWFLEQAPSDAIGKHFVAVSTNIDKVKEFGIDEANIFPMWDWVGGRFSLWSAVGLTISLALGYSNFEELLLGAHKMDVHFKEESFDSNMPVILALLSVWYNNFFHTESEAIIPYSQYLNQFATYLQQGIMESNGKSVDRAGNKINYQTGTIIWGEPGTNSQHAFFQLIHQGTKLIPADFIGFAKSLYGNQDHQDKLISNYIAQTEALMKGKTEDEVLNELHGGGLTESEIQNLLPYKVFDGNKPTNSIFIEKLTPESLGKLISLYEHKIFVQGVIWNIFSFDQFGVELGKQLAKSILDDIQKGTFTNHDASTSNLLNFYSKNR